jgi:hypothetical protein
VGRLPHQPRGRFRDAAVDRDAARLAAGRGRCAARALARLNNDKDYAEEAMKIIQFVPQYETGADINGRIRKRLEVKPEIRRFVADYIKSAKR